MTNTTLARADALATASHQLRTERAAVILCDRNGWTTDAAFAQSEVTRLEALIRRLTDTNPGTITKNGK